MAETKSLIKKLTPFLADHSKTTPLFGSKMRWAWETWSRWAYTFPQTQKATKNKVEPYA